MEQIARSVEDAHVGNADDSGQDAEQHIPGERGGVGEANARLAAEYGRPPRPGSEDAVADHRGDEAWNDDIRLEVANVQNFGAQNRAAERGLENGPDAG